MDQTEKPFFIVGNERSGTTMLRFMLNAHPNLHVPGENDFMSVLMARHRSDEKLSSAEVRAAFEIVTSDRRWSHWDIDAAELFKLLDSLSQPYLGEFIAKIFEHSCKKFNKVRWGNKHPTNVSKIEEINAFFPDAKFVHIIRDPRDVCVSMSHTRWHGGTVREIAARWRDQVQAGIRSGRKLGPSKYFEFFYEDLVLDSGDTLEKICEFIGEPYDERMLDFHELIEQDRTLKLTSKKLTRAPRASDVSRWHRELGPLQIIVVEFMVGDMLRELNYELKYSGALRIVPYMMGGVIWLAEITLPVRRRLGLHFPRLSEKL